MAQNALRILVLGAHPDDAEFHAGALLARHAALGSTIRMVSVTDGRSGHQSIPSNELITIRKQEAANAGKVIGSEYVTWDYPDGSLMPTLEVRHSIIREIRSFAPDLVLTHRTCDYHPDHRAVGQAVQDASYLVMVPKVVPDIPALERDPIVAYMNDTFSRPTPMRADAVIDGTVEFEKAIEMMSCHASQFYDWMPWIERIRDTVPETDIGSKKSWLRSWYLARTESRRNQFWDVAKWGKIPLHVEAFEISEYASKADPHLISRLFPGNVK